MMSTFFPVKSERETCCPSESGRVNAGAFVCSAIMIVYSIVEWFVSTVFASKIIVPLFIDLPHDLSLRLLQYR